MARSGLSAERPCEATIDLRALRENAAQARRLAGPRELIAVVKASLVALIFMHLNAEKSLIYKVLLFTVFFFFGLMFLSLFEVWDPIHAQFLSTGE